MGALERLPLPQPIIDPEEQKREQTQVIDLEKRYDERVRREKKKSKEDPFVNRKPISEVLHDIYDKNIQ